MQSQFNMFVTNAPDPDARQAIASGLRHHNEQHAGQLGSIPLAVLLTRNGQNIGGLWGRCYYQWLYIELLFVPEELRGQSMGAQLIARAEAEARKRGCVGAHLDTFTFQAPDFYERLGYVRFGELHDFPPGHSRIFLQKIL